VSAADESPIKNWSLEISEPAPSYLLFRKWSGKGSPPEVIVWNGRGFSGELARPATSYPFMLMVIDVHGNSSVYEGLVEVDFFDNDGPVLSAALAPRPFSPDDDGVEDELEIRISANDESPIRGWKIEIREPHPPYRLFKDYHGEGSPPETVVWDGRSSWGEVVQAATDYPYVLTAADVHGNSAAYHGRVEVDILVQREPNDVLRVRVPSIVFGENSGGFTDLTSEQTKTNDQILRKIAGMLKKFDGYQMRVEGHANPTTPPGSRERRIEEEGSRQEKGLKPLSEERAQAVVDYLVSLGIDPSRLTASGVGSERTLVDYTDTDNWWKNRRVEFILLK
jgi:outer membrane protein OmpA-like peptidoglycan-associated protein